MSYYDQTTIKLNNIPESLTLLNDCLIKGVAHERYSHKEWMEICNALDYVAMKLGYKEVTMVSKDEPRYVEIKSKRDV
jgi:hypothetical protein|tara:strand:- start:240 stop:473 length:234 start_codon:yes stop_codon:yes gene_type:complete